MRAILTLNAGSSSIKFAVFDRASPADLTLIAKGHVAQSGGGSEFEVADGDGHAIERSSDATAFDHDKAAERLFGWLDTHRGGLDIAAVGHRVVHGGEQFVEPVVITDEVLRSIDGLTPLAPLHQPFNIAAIRLALARFPNVLQVASFDTAFHANQPWVARALPLPARLTDAGLRRYGFHGLSYEYIVSQLPRVLGDKSQAKVIVAHLGNGASLCAIEQGRSVATTMGFSALDGLMMGSRCGALDPGVVLYLLQSRHMSVDEVSDLLYEHSGLLGVSGISNDMQELAASTDPRAAAAVDLFVHGAVMHIGSLAAALGGVDALVFTGGIGEHAAAIRARICEGCGWLGALLDTAANTAHHESIHAAGSRLRLAVVPTDEERMIALHASARIAATSG